MFTYSIQCYHQSNQISINQPQIFILSKGLNSGKPLDNPCPNCFVITVKTEEEKQFLFWLCWGLWQSKKLYHLHTGSVIPFIRLYEFKQFLKDQAATAFANKGQYHKNVKTLQQLEQLEKSYKQNLLLIMDEKKAIFQRYIIRR